MSFPLRLVSGCALVNFNTKATVHTNERFGKKKSDRAIGSVGKLASLPFEQLDIWITADRIDVLDSSSADENRLAPPAPQVYIQ
jgi:hypothetical protein